MRKIAILLALSMMLTAFTACGSSDENLTDTLVLNEDDPYYFLNGMIDGELYVLHGDNTYSPAVFNAATFKWGSIPDSANTGRVIWFKEDFNDIPTFYDGSDKLVMYTRNPVTEKIVLERFKDLGISVGICGMKPLDSGKYSLSTDPDDNNTYPGSDADEILNFRNETVIIDTVQGIKMRTDERLKLNEEQNVVYSDAQTKGVTEYGTITNLAPNNYFDIDIYDGSEKVPLKLYSDTHILGSCTLTKGLNYHFTDNYLQEFELPKDLQTGYYTINSLGIFRYIKAGDTYSMNTDYNVGINEDNAQYKQAKEKADEEYISKYVEPEQSQTIYGSSKKTDIIEAANERIEEQGDIPEEPEEDIVSFSYEIDAQDVFVRFFIEMEAGPEETANARATITTPNGVAIDMSRVKSTGSLYSDVYVETGGEFTVTMHDMSSYNPSTKVDVIDESEVRTGDIE